MLLVYSLGSDGLCERLRNKLSAMSAEQEESKVYFGVKSRSRRFRNVLGVEVGAELFESTIGSFCHTIDVLNYLLLWLYFKVKRNWLPLSILKEANRAVFS